MRIQARCFPLAGGDEGIVPLVERCHLGDHPAVLARRLHIVIGSEKGRGQGTSTEIGAEIAGASDQIWLVDTEDFRLGNDHLNVKIMLQRMHVTVLKLSAEALEHPQRLLHRLAHVLRGWQILLPVVAQYTDPESLYILSQRRTVIR